MSESNILKINQYHWNLLKEQVTNIQEAKEIKETCYTTYIRLALQMNAISFVISQIETENKIKPSGKRKRNNELEAEPKRRRVDDVDDFFVKRETDSDVEIVEDEPAEVIEADTPQLKVHALVIDRVLASDMLDFKVDRADEDVIQPIINNCESTNTNEKTFHCDVCDRKFPDKQNLRNHLNREHGGVHKCQNCVLRFTSGVKLASHACAGNIIDTVPELTVDQADQDELQLVDNCVSFDSSQNSFDCDVCNKQLSDKNTLKYHQNYYHGGYHKCEACGSRFTSNTKLLNHVCEASSQAISADLEKYIQPTAMKSKRGKLYKCTKCEHVKPQEKWRIKNHIRSKHTGENPFECEICNKKFADYETLHEHMNLKHGTHKCKKCTHRFVTKLELDNHNCP